VAALMRTIIGMPDIDGYSLMRNIRMLDDAQKSEIPAVALTLMLDRRIEGKQFAPDFKTIFLSPWSPRS
jgi:CheY-like chemotaxis protein